jgi:hypothetical protein
MSTAATWLFDEAATRFSAAIRMARRYPPASVPQAPVLFGIAAVVIPIAVLLIAIRANPFELILQTLAPTTGIASPGCEQTQGATLVDPSHNSTIV